jgi:hypothetical protein
MTTIGLEWFFVTTLPQTQRVVQPTFGERYDPVTTVIIPVSDGTVDKSTERTIRVVTALNARYGTAVAETL